MLIRCPKCEFERDVPEEKIPTKAKLATCPKCGYKFNFKEKEPNTNNEQKAFPEKEDGLKQEQSKSDIWSVLESLDPDSNEDKDDYNDKVSGSLSAEQGEVPWEHLYQYGFFPGFFQTIKEVMLSPASFFANMRLGQGFNKPLIFYLLIAEVQALAQFFWQAAGVVPQMQNKPESILEIGMTGMGSIMLLLIYPVILTIMLFLVSGLNHMCLLAVQAASKSFEGTFRVVSYSDAPMILALIPVIGPFAGMIWSLVCTFLGFKYMHRTTSGKVILAMLLPIIVLIMFSSIIVMIKGIARM